MISTNQENKSPENTNLIIAPSTEAQLEVWISCMLGGDDANRAYNLSVSLYLHGDLKHSLLDASIADIVSRHEAFRSVFSSDGSQVIISPEINPNIKFINIDNQGPDEQKESTSAYISADINTSFDLSNGPLYNISLLRLSADRHVLIFTIHHIVCDGWSMKVFLDELAKLYSAKVKQEEPDLEHAVSFHRYAEEQARFVGSDDYRLIEQYWVDQFSDSVPVLELPKDFPMPAFRTTKSKRIDRVLSRDLFSGLNALALKEKSTQAITLRAIFEILLYKITGQEDIVLGMPTAGQAATGNFNLISHCINLLPLRSRLNENLSFRQYLQERKFATLDAYDNQQFTFGSLLKKLNIPRDNSRVPLVSVVFNSDTATGEGLHFEGLTYELRSNKRDYENFEIFINATSSAGDLTIEWTYNEQLFKAETITNMMNDYLSIMGTVIENPDIEVGDILLRASIELNKNISSWNNTAVEYPRDKTVFKLIGDAAAMHPKRTAISFRDSRISYQDLEKRSGQFAHFLIKHGISPGDKIALAVDRSIDMIVALLGIMKAGAVYIPVDPGFPKKRIDYMLSDAAARLLIKSESYKKHFAETHILQIVLEDMMEQLPAFPGSAPEIKPSGDEIAYIMYTSGTTGRPKGIAIEHHSLTNFLLSMQKVPGMNAADKLLAVTTISFDISGLEIYLPLISGAELVLTNADTARDGRELLEILRTRNISVMQATPSTWRMMFDSGWHEPLKLKALCGGEPLPQDLAAMLLSKTSELWNMYGPTETTIWSTAKRITNVDDPITVGRPIANTQIYILDKRLKPVPQGSTGEIYIGGEGLARYYLNRPDLTSENFLKDPFSKNPKGRMYRSGDLGMFMPDGEIRCFGRIDNQVKVRGFRIELGAIEYLLNSYDGVKESVAAAREDRPGDQRLVAYVVPEQPGDDKTSYRISVTNNINAERVAGWKHQLRERLPEYMIPGEIIILNTLPLLPNGKVDRASLPSPADVSEMNAIAGTKKAMPKTEMEKLVASVWEEYLSIESVGLNDDFFEVGGHSMIAVKVMARLEKETGQRLPLASLFEHSTVKGMAMLLQADSTAISWDSLVSIKPRGNKMPLYIVHGAGLNVLPFDTLAKNLDEEQPVYGLQARGLNGIDEPLEKIEDMAAYYIEEILEQNPDGPYALAGFSFGGLIAFDMAKQLKTMGKEVKVIAIFDSYVEPSDRYDPFFKKMFNRTRFLFNQIAYTFTLLKEDPKRTIQYKTESLKRRIISFYWKYRYGKNNNQQGFYGYSHAVDIKNLEAADKYVLTPYNGYIDLFRAKKKLFYMDDFEYLGWKPYALKGIRIHEIPGEHNYIFDYPNVKDFAIALQKCLDDAAAK